MVYAHANNFNHVGEFFLGEIRNQTLRKPSSCEGIKMAVIKFCTVLGKIQFRYYQKVPIIDVCGKFYSAIMVKAGVKTLTLPSFLLIWASGLAFLRCSLLAASLASIFAAALSSGGCGLGCCSFFPSTGASALGSLFCCGYGCLISSSTLGRMGVTGFDLQGLDA